MATILLVYEDGDLRFILRTLLAYKGYNVVETRSASIAVGTAVRIVPSAILLDLDLPEGGAWDALAKLRSDLRTATVPVIGFSGETIDQAFAKKAGFSACLMKPIRLSDLVSSLDRVLRGGDIVVREDPAGALRAAMTLPPRAGRARSLRDHDHPR